MSQPPPLYEAQDLRHYYGQRLVLDLPSLSIGQGEVVGLAGANGSGKSTLLRLLALLESPSQGRLLVRGRQGLQALPRGAGGVTLLLQEPYLLHRTVKANLAYGLAYGLKGRLGRDQAAERVAEALAWVGLDPAVFGRRAWYQLSGGETRRVALAARLALRPLVLLLDEPTSGVDSASAELIHRAFVRANQEWGSTLVVTSHDLAWLHGLSDRVFSLREGRLAP
jgi:tungstate transport system ATP-binding protein